MLPRHFSFAYLFAASQLIASMVATPGLARDFFPSFAPNNQVPASFATPSTPFGQFGVDDTPRTRIIVRPPVRRNLGTASRTFCVRTCDGRYFPMSSAVSDQAKDYCRSACPATETKIYTGNSIEQSIATDGKPYMKILHAFRFRNESVPGCTCQGGGRAGLAQIRIQDDKTIRSGDIVAQANGLMVASQGRNGLIFTRVSASRIKAERLPAVAAR